MTGSEWGLGYIGYNLGFAGGGVAIKSGTISIEPLLQITLLYDPTRAVKSGGVIPIKVALEDSTGANISGPDHILHATQVVQTSASTTSTVIDAGSSNPGSDFRYDATLGGYIFNLQATGLSGSYDLHFTVDGSGDYTAPFQVR